MVCYNIPIATALQELPLEQNKKNIAGIKNSGIKDIVTVDMVEFILKYRTIILKMLYGSPRPDGSTEGTYAYGQQSYGIQALAVCEKYAKKDQHIQSALENALKEAKNDFILKTEPFIGPAQKMKSIIINIINEIEHTKNPPLKLFAWHHLEEQQEMLAFNISIKNFADLEVLCIEILHILNKILERAPQAVAHLYERIEKWQKTKQFLHEFEEEGLISDSFDKKAFLRYVKQNYADLLLLGEFTKDQIEIILQEYIVRYT